MTETERWLRSYYRRIRSFLPCSYKQKKQLITGIRQNVALYLEENPEADIRAIQGHFGTPDQIAAACLEEISLPELLRRLRIKRKILAIIGITATLCVVTYSTVMAILAKESASAINGYYEIGPADEESNEEIIP